MDEPSTPPEPNRFRDTLTRVLIVQVLTLLALWLIQRRYGG